MQIFLLNLYIGTRRGSGIDNLAHAGGFVAGALCGALLSPRGSAADAEDDGAIVPPLAVRALLGAVGVTYVLGLRQAARLTPVMARILAAGAR